jgi:hypothetical protein
MSSQKRSVTIHDNEYERIKFNKPKRPKWVSEGTSNFFMSFQQRSEKERRSAEADKILSVSGLSTKMLDEKYGHIDDVYLAFSDISGLCLWTNQATKDCCAGYETVMEPLRGKYLSEIQKSDKFKGVKERLEHELPSSLELQDIPLPGGFVLLSLKYVCNHEFSHIRSVLIQRKECQ